MRGTAINTMYYAGTVTLSLLIGNEKKLPVAKIQNAGTSSLFNFFTDCLVGDFELAKNARPTKIRLLRVTRDPTTQEVVETKSESHFIYLLTRPEKIYSSTEQGESVRYSFVIPRTLLDSASFNRIGLYSDGASGVEDFSAYCDVSFDDGSLPSWGSSSVLTVDWELNISNKPKA